MHEVITIGEPMVMFISKTVGTIDKVKNFEKSLAGAEANVSIGLTRLGHKVGYIAKVGSDPFGKYINDFLTDEGISVEYIKYDKNYQTGLLFKSKNLVGDPQVTYYRRDSAASHITAEDIVNLDLKGTKVVHITGIFPALSEECREATYALIKKSKENNITITFDPNIRQSLWDSEDQMRDVLNDIASKSDIVLPGINEGKILTGFDKPEDIAAFYLSRGSKYVIIKTGEDGAYVRTQKESYMVPGFKVNKIVDTVGAGDGFAVGIISGLLEGMELKDAVVRANAIGALQVMSPGDNDGMPDQEKLNMYLKSTKSI